MLQRTGIAAAILHRPRLVILDEPMNGLDPLGRSDFRDLVLSLRSEGATIFLSSHVLGDIENMADRVGILHEGHLIECGSLAEILAGDGRGVEILFEIEPGPVLSEIAPSFEDLVVGPQGWFGLVKDANRADWVARRILDAGGRLLRYDRRRTSLEEFFVQRISGAGGPAPLRSASPQVARSARAVPRSPRPNRATEQERVAP
jgi:ABC-type multidrug transport system ATPase subunit